MPRVWIDPLRRTWSIWLRFTYSLCICPHVWSGPRPSEAAPLCICPHIKKGAWGTWMGSYCGSISSLRESLLYKHKQSWSCGSGGRGPFANRLKSLRLYQTGTRDCSDDIPHCVMLCSDAPYFKRVTSWTSMKMKEEGKYSAFSSNVKLDSC